MPAPRTPAPRMPAPRMPAPGPRAVPPLVPEGPGEFAGGREGSLGRRRVRGGVGPRAGLAG
eukprot:5367924-Lingulodinium_polyedra.AAC.1